MGSLSLRASLLDFRGLLLVHSLGPPPKKLGKFTDVEVDCRTDVGVPSVIQSSMMDTVRLRTGSLDTLYYLQITRFYD